MAERRMFHASVVESDTFLELPMGAQALYFHLGMHADDDGFVNNPRQIVRNLRRPRKELQQLIETGFLLAFDGIVVIRHWRMANRLRGERMQPLRYPSIAKALYILHNREYSLEPQGLLPTLYDLRRPLLAAICPTNITEDKITQENITEGIVDQDKQFPDPWEQDVIADPMGYMRSLQERALFHPRDERKEGLQ